MEIDQNVVTGLSKAVIASPLDAIVELVTNADDSYRRMEDRGERTTGEIDVFVRRQTGGRCLFLSVADKAEGMDWRALQRALRYGAPTSDHREHRTVRGLFGRGLKEAILALGRGQIITTKDSWQETVQLFRDPDRGYMLRRFEREQVEPSCHGTRVEIEVEVEEQRAKVGEWNTLREGVTGHYALRRVAGSDARRIVLALENVDAKGARSRRGGYRSDTVRYTRPAGTLVVDISRDIPGLGRVRIRVFEAEVELQLRDDATSQAGLEIQTEGVTLDLTRAGYENEPAFRYFYGEVDCPGLADLLWEQQASELIHPDRSGLNWSRQPLRELRGYLAEVLAPLVEGKRNELTAGRPPRVPRSLQTRLQELCRRLNQFARAELEVERGGEGPGPTPTDVTGLTIYPERGNADPGQPRGFTVYIPLEVAGMSPPPVEVELQDIYGDVRVDGSGQVHTLHLRAHGHHPTLLTGSFRVVGAADGHRATIVASFRDQPPAVAYFQVHAPRHLTRRPGQPSRSGGGMFSQILFERMPGATRATYRRREGSIVINTEFPGFDDIVGRRLERAGTEPARVLLSEIVTEAFCRQIASARVEQGLVTQPVSPAAMADRYMQEFDELRMKYICEIYRVLRASGEVESA